MPLKKSNDIAIKLKPVKRKVGSASISVCVPSIVPCILIGVSTDRALIIQDDDIDDVPQSTAHRKGPKQRKRPIVIVRISFLYIMFELG